MILDTNALSAAADEDRGVIAVLSQANEIALPVVVLGEYRYGMSESRNRNRYEAWLRGFLADCAVLEISERTTHFYAAIHVELKRMGRPIPTNDMWIAALGRQHSLPIVSRDHHFDLVKECKRIDW